MKTLRARRSPKHLETEGLIRTSPLSSDDRAVVLTDREIARWARKHELPYDNGHVRFPDARIEYEDRDGRSRHEDLEVVTGHYRGAHAGSAAKSGFTCDLSIGCRSVVAAAAGG